MRVLLVEPQYRRRAATIQEKAAVEGAASRRDDTSLWYPPLGLMKLARFHRDRGDEVRFASGCDESVIPQPDLFTPAQLWDRVYITTLFTFHFDTVVKTIRFYLKAVGGTVGRLYVGGIMASLMPEAIFEETGVYPLVGLLTSPEQIGLSDDVNIDLLSPDYDLLNSNLYALNDTYYGYTTRGCTNSCPWCGVPKIEPEFVPYINIKPMISELRSLYGDKPILKLMDNNVLASPRLPHIVSDLVALGYGKGQLTASEPRRQRVVDFNQGLDASYINPETADLISRVNIRPMRFAFDRVGERDTFARALELLHEYGVSEFSVYMLYNFNDSPRDLYERLRITIDLNEKWLCGKAGRLAGPIWSYPMRYAPIDETRGVGSNRERDAHAAEAPAGADWLAQPHWTPRFLRNIEIMKGAAHGAISNTPSLALRTIGSTFEEFLLNLYMPEELLRNRNKHERRVYEYEPDRAPGSGKVEDFRAFMLSLLRKSDQRFQAFHGAVTQNLSRAVREAIAVAQDDEEAVEWLKLYLKPA